MKNIILIIVLSVCFVLNGFAQKKEADEKFNLYEYAKAIPLYEKYIKDNPTDYDAHWRLANSYKLNNQVDKAISTYKTIIGLNGSSPEDLYSLSRLLMSQSQLEDAKGFATQYQKKEPGEKANVLLASIEQYNSFIEDQNKYTIVNKTDKYSYSVFAAQEINGQIFVTAESNKDDSKWTGRGSTDIYTTDNSFNKLNKFADNIMSNKDDGFPVFTNGGNVLYFTRVNKNGVNENNINTRKLHLVYTEKVDGKWTEPKEFAYNNNSYNTAHATISEDGKVLIFASDKPGGKGGMDLYMCNNIGGSWSQPQNISSLNTYGNEIFPLFNNSKLYFSSDGLPGMGGLDIYSTELSNTNFSMPKNVNAPINSSFDDFYLSTKNNFTSGYISSNRFGNTDDVLSFAKANSNPVPTPTPTPVATSTVCPSLKIKVVDKYTNIVLPYVEVAVKNDKGEVLQKGMTDENGMIEVEEICKGKYSIQGELNGITTTIAKINEDEFSGAPIEKELKHNDPRFTLRGIVINSTTGKPLAGVKVKNANQTAGKEQEVTTGENGEFFFQLQQNSDFKVSGQKPKWLSSETAEVTTKGLDRSKELYVKLSLNMVEPTANAVIRLDKIFYDLNKSDLRPRSMTELDRVVKLMNDYADMKVELSSHTDCRNTHDYNEKLSQRRSESAVSYILSKGISKDRIVAKGYGETKIVNECADGVQCSEEQHQLNRRTEFTILECASCPK